MLLYGVLALFDKKSGVKWNMIIFIVFLLIGMLLLILMMYRKGLENNLTKHTFTFEHLPKSFSPLRIFFISDIHRRGISTSLLEQVPNSIDLVIIGGDLSESGVPQKRIEENIKMLQKMAPTYFVFGNNDYEIGKGNLEKCLKKYNVTLLNNTSKSVTNTSGETIYLIGVEDMSEEKDRLDIALDNVPQKSFKLLISHNPDIYQKVKRQDEIALILSGHQHGGQIRLLGYGLYKKGKVHRLKNSILLISNGYGTSGLPLRLGAPAEAHYIEIRNKMEFK